LQHFAKRFKDSKNDTGISSLFMKDPLK